MHVQVDIEKKNVLIIGWPASGKTYLSELLAQDNPNHVLIHTDDFIKYGYKESLYVILASFAKLQGRPTIIEGIQGYRLLRKGLELNVYYPDIVIELQITEALMFKTYKRERPMKAAGFLKSFNKMHQKILNDYQTMLDLRPKSFKRPQWIQLKNSY